MLPTAHSMASRTEGELKAELEGVQQATTEAAAALHTLNQAFHKLQATVRSNGLPKSALHCAIPCKLSFTQLPFGRAHSQIEAVETTASEQHWAETSRALQAAGRQAAAMDETL